MPGNQAISQVFKTALKVKQTVLSDVYTKDSIS